MSSISAGLWANIMANKTKITAEPGKQETFITREFDAPRELVFKAHTDPELYTGWLGPRDLIMTLEKFEPRAGVHRLLCSTS